MDSMLWPQTLKRELLFSTNSLSEVVSERPPSVDGNDLWRDDVERLNNVLVPHGGSIKMWISKTLPHFLNRSLSAPRSIEELGDFRSQLRGDVELLLPLLRWNV